MKSIKESKKCQLCGNKELTTLIDFGLSELANDLKETENEQKFLAPLELVMCNNPKCNCIQLKHLVNSGILFTNYNYRSSKGLDKHFQEYSRHTYSLLKLKPRDLVVEIGGNVGFLCQAYNNIGLNSVNVEPAQNIAFESRENGVETIADFFNKKVANDIVNKYGKAKLVCANNVMCHCLINHVFEGIREVLDKDGVFIFENCNWLESVKQKDFFQIYSEHYRYATVKAFSNYFNLQGYDVFKVEFNNIQLGTIRFYVKSKKNKKFDIDKSVQEAIKNEEDFGLYKPETYSKALVELNDIKVKLNNILNELKHDGKKIGLLGVAAKSVLQLKYLEIGQYIDFATDDSTLKHNKFIPGQNIKILPKDEFWAQKPDYVIPIYNFFDQIVNNNKDRDCKWLRTIPNIEIV